MIDLLAVLTPIGLLDSLSIVPLCIVPMVVLLSGPSPLFRSFAFVLGIFVAYLACGLLILLGLQSVFDELNAYAVRLWQSPHTEELIAQIILGIVLCGFAVRIMRGRKARSERPATSGMTALQAALAGAGLTIVGLPGAVPYLAAIDLILRDEITEVQRILALGYYNLVFVVPLTAIVALRLVLGERCQALLHGVKRVLDKWSPRIVVALLMLLGVVLTADGIGWFLGTPLIPV